MVGEGRAKSMYFFPGLLSAELGVTTIDGENERLNGSGRRKDELLAGNIPKVAILPLDVDEELDAGDTEREVSGDSLSDFDREPGRITRCWCGLLGNEYLRPPRAGTLSQLAACRSRCWWWLCHQ